jgi:hypothetical protein
VKAKYKLVGTYTHWHSGEKMYSWARFVPDDRTTITTMSVRGFWRGAEPREIK